jgi:hypothetical protein
MTGVPEDFQLSPSDKASSLWRRLKAHLDDRLARLRIQNDNPQADGGASIRGEIRAVKSLIALGEDRPVITE